MIATLYTEVKNHCSLLTFHVFERDVDTFEIEGIERRFEISFGSNVRLGSSFECMK